jgi:hypothetical protein
MAPFDDRITLVVGRAKEPVDARGEGRGGTCRRESVPGVHSPCVPLSSFFLSLLSVSLSRPPPHLPPPAALLVDSQRRRVLRPELGLPGFLQSCGPGTSRSQPLTRERKLLRALGLERHAVYTRRQTRGVERPHARTCMYT